MVIVIVDEDDETLYNNNNNNKCKKKNKKKTQLMSWFKEEPRNFPILASRDLLPNLWLKYERSDRVPLRKSDCMSTFAALTSDMKKTHADKVLWTSLEVIVFFRFQYHNVIYTKQSLFLFIVVYCCLLFERISIRKRIWVRSVIGCRMSSGRKRRRSCAIRSGIRRSRRAICVTRGWRAHA